MATHSSILSEEFHGQRYSPWGRKELDTTEQLTLTFTSQGIFLTQGSKLHVLNLQEDSLQLSHLRSPR